MSAQERSEPQAASLDEAIAEYLRAADAGAPPEREAFLARHPAQRDELAAWLEDHARMARVAAAGDELEELGPGVLLGPYELGAPLGRGGMGTVFRARHRDLGRAVAVKVLAPRWSRDPQLVARFRREARALAQLDHEHIVRVHDMGLAGGRSYIAMELVEGTNLRELMRAGQMDPERALAIVPALCSALEYAHGRGVVHRDIKPENILVDREGRVKIVDFGLARMALGDEGLGTLTRTDVVMGTYDYMAPEQKRTAAVDHRADIYALGVVLFEMLTGELPVGRFRNPSERTPLDTRIDEVVGKALEAEPERRYQNASELGEAVDALRSGGAAAIGRAAAPAAGGAVPLDVLELDTRAPLGGGWAEEIVLVTHHAHALELRRWGSPEVGCSFAGKAPQVRAMAADDDGPARVELRLPRKTGTVWIPPGLAVRVVAQRAPIEASGLEGRLAIGHGAGRVTIRGHRGPLRVERLGDAKLEVDGLESSDFHLTTQSGELLLAGLAQGSGRGELTSDAGDVRVGLLLESSSLRYEACAPSGRLVDRWSKGRLEGRRARGTLGAGAGELAVTSHGGDVHLRGSEDLLGRVWVRDSARALVWPTIVTAFFLYRGSEVAALVCGVWLATTLWACFRELRRGTLRREPGSAAAARASSTARSR